MLTQDTCTAATISDPYPGYIPNTFNCFCGQPHPIGTTCPTSKLLSFTYTTTYWCVRCHAIHPSTYLCPNADVSTPLVAQTANPRKLSVTPEKILIDDQIEILIDSVTQVAELSSAGKHVSIRIKARDASDV